MRIDGLNDARYDDGMPEAEHPEGAYFKSLTLRNVRAFGDEGQTIDFTDDDGNPAAWTVILGENGVGKTTVLQCLLGFGQDIEDIKHRDSPCPRWDRWVAMTRFSFFRRAASKFSVEAKLSKGGGRGTEASVHFEFSDRRSSEGWSEVFEPLPHCEAYGAGRRIPPAAASESLKASTHYLATPDFDYVELIDAEDWLLRLDYGRRRGGQQKRFEQVKAVLIDVLPEVSDVRLSERPTESDGAESYSYEQLPEVEFETPYGWMRLGELGLGYQTMIAWVVDFVARLFERFPKVANPLEMPAVCLVDEVDLHLHPKWQRDCKNYLTRLFPNTQFIVTAHSPLVAQAAVDANIVLLKREGDRVVVENDPVKVRNWRIDQVLTSELFGLESARPPQAEGDLHRRKELLSKRELTEEDRRELDAVNERIGSLPTGERPKDAALDLQQLPSQVRALAEKIRGRRDDQS